MLASPNSALKALEEMPEYRVYHDAVEAVLRALDSLVKRGRAPRLVCVPDVLVLEKEGPGDKKTQRGKPSPERFMVPQREYDLDGHACISALTAAYLNFGLIAEYEVWLLAKVGPAGKGLLDSSIRDLRKHGCSPFKCYVKLGDDRKIGTPINKSHKVSRRIDKATVKTQLSWEEFGSLHCLKWLQEQPYGLIVGDSESSLASNLGEIVRSSAATVIDTSTWSADKDGSVLARQMWDTIKSLVDGKSFVSVSDRDAETLGRFLNLSSTNESVQQQLASSLRRGFLVYHTSDTNQLLSCADGRVLEEVPACDIHPQTTNGAGDTFNGALALAATSLLLTAGGDPSVNVANATQFRHILAFATAVVSLRLENGHYANREELTHQVASLFPKRTLAKPAAPLLSDPKNHQGVHAEARWTTQAANVLMKVWSDVPRVALIDLDHTLCDSKAWREMATVAACEAAGIGNDEGELLEMYRRIYKDHLAWAPIIGADIRYQWKHEGLFGVLLALQADRLLRLDNNLLDPKAHGYRRLHSEVARQRKQQPEAVKLAVRTFEVYPAHPYPDVLGALHELRDVLGFRLMVVTEGDKETQEWKIGKLGLKELFPEGSIRSDEEAFPTNEWMADAFARAKQTTPDMVATLEEAETIYLRSRENYKDGFRALTLRHVVSAIKRQSQEPFVGVHVCTIGDRIDTDVVPYLAVKPDLDGKLGSDPGKYSGVLISRLRRGPYASQEPKESEKPDLTIDSWHEFVDILATERFWRRDPPIIDDKIGPLLHLPTRSDFAALRKAGEAIAGLDYFIETLEKATKGLSEGL